MSKNRYIRPPTTLLGTEPFLSAEEAWFWFVRCQKARDDGMRFVRGMEVTARPCFPDDIYRALKALTARRVIGLDHVKVLKFFGYMERPPDPRCAEEELSHVLWDEAFDRLGPELKSKDIVQ